MNDWNRLLPEPEPPGPSRDEVAPEPSRVEDPQPADPDPLDAPLAAVRDRVRRGWGKS